MSDLNISIMAGMTLIDITGTIGDDNIGFIADTGRSFSLYHDQDCCEGVFIEEIIGDLDDLLGSPLLIAEERSSIHEEDFYYDGNSSYESVTWTFYELATIKGSVTIRWIGYSNGYYSEIVSFKELGVDEED